MDLKVNDDEWSAIASADQQQIEQIVKSFFDDVRIVPDPATPASPSQTMRFKIPNPLCKIVCDTLQASASAACVGLGNPVAVAACLALATAAGEECRKKC